MDPVLEKQLSGKNYTERADYYMARDDFAGVELKPAILSVICRFFNPDLNVPKVNDFAKVPFSDNQIEFIKEFLRKSPVSETDSI